MVQVVDSFDEALAIKAELNLDAPYPFKYQSSLVDYIRENPDTYTLFFPELMRTSMHVFLEADLDPALLLSAHPHQTIVTLILETLGLPDFKFNGNPILISRIVDIHNRLNAAGANAEAITWAAGIYLGSFDQIYFHEPSPASIVPVLLKFGHLNSFWDLGVSS